MWSLTSESSSLESRTGSSNQEEQEVDVSFAKRADDALLAGMQSAVGVSGWLLLDPDQRDRE